jgi:hypothetical protein
MSDYTPDNWDAEYAMSCAYCGSADCDRPSKLLTDDLPMEEDYQNE